MAEISQMTVKIRQMNILLHSLQQFIAGKRAQHAMPYNILFFVTNFCMQCLTHAPQDISCSHAPSSTLPNVLQALQARGFPASAALQPSTPYCLPNLHCLTAFACLPCSHCLYSPVIPVLSTTSTKRFCANMYSTSSGNTMSSVPAIRIDSLILCCLPVPVTDE